MIVSTKAIVISKVKYKDHDLIVKCYTESHGVLSFLARGVLSSKKRALSPAYFQALSILNLQFDYKNSSGLHYFKAINPSYHFKTIHTTITKSTVALFLAEILHKTLHEEESNLPLFEYIETTLLWFDTIDADPMFHHKFLLGLTKYLGFSPDNSNSHFPFFNLEEGAYQATKSGPFSLSGQKLILFNTILGMKFDTIIDKPIHSDDRKELLHMILRYFKLHLQGFKSPKSLAVLNQVFG